MYDDKSWVSGQGGICRKDQLPINREYHSKASVNRHELKQKCALSPLDKEGRPIIEARFNISTPKNLKIIFFEHSNGFEFFSFYFRFQI